MDKQQLRALLWLAAAAALVAICDAKLTRDEEKEFLVAHNVAREAVGAPPLRWSNNLASNASNLLPRPSVGASCELPQKPPASCDYALNEAVANLKDSPAAVVASWVDEKGDSYTRVVSRGEAELGCGKGNCGKDGSHIVCLYSHPGIVAGDRLD